jgi:hypothetical protein
MKGRLQKNQTKRGWPIIGNIKVGVKHPEKGYPMSLDYFVCDSDYREMFMEACGGKPSSLPITFVSDEFEQSCNEYLECRDGQGRLVGRYDGEEYKVRTAKNPEWMVVDESKVNLAKWKHVLELKFIILSIRGVMGLWKLRTMGTVSSIPAIRDAFDNVKDMAGTVVKVPFDLSVKKVKSNKPGEKSTFPVISLVPNVSNESMRKLSEYVSNDMDQLKTLAVYDDNSVLQLNETNDG